jgi:hypothetical protein
MVLAIRVRDIQNCQIEWIKVRGGFAWYFENFGDLVLTQPTYTQCEFTIVSALPNHAVVAPVVVRGSRYVFKYGEGRHLVYRGYKKEETIELSFQLENIISPYFYYLIEVYKNIATLYQRFSYFDNKDQSWSPAIPMALLL